MIGLEISEAEVARAGDELTRWLLTQLTAAVGDETRGLEKDLEQITRLAVRGKLWRAWRSDVFPKRLGPARKPTGTVFVNGGKRSQGAMSFFTQEGRITAGGGQYLAIPTEAAGSQGRTRNLTPGEWERRHGERLRFVYRRGRPSLLVLDEGVLSGRRQVARKNSARRRASGRGNATIVIFVLVPFVDFQKRFAIGPLISRREGRLQANIERRIGGTG